MPRYRWMLRRVDPGAAAKAAYPELLDLRTERYLNSAAEMEQVKRVILDRP